MIALFSIFAQQTKIILKCTGVCINIAAYEKLMSKVTTVIDYFILLKMEITDWIQT